MLQPLEDWVTQVRMSSPEHFVAASVAQPVPAVVPSAGQTHAPPEQVCEPRQLVTPVIVWQAGVLPSAVQVARVFASTQNALVPTHSLLQVHAAEGSAPWQVSCVGQAAGVPEMKKQPCASAAQVASCPEPLQKVPACEHPLGAALQTHAPEEQVWRVPQAASVPHTVQPVLARTHVCVPPFGPH